MKEKSKMKTYTIRISSELYEKIQKAAKKKERSMNYLISKALEKEFQKNNQ